MHRSALAKVAEITVIKKVVANMGARTVVVKKVASLTVVGSLVAKEKMAKDHLDSKVKDKDPLKAVGPAEAHVFVSTPSERWRQRPAKRWYPITMRITDGSNADGSSGK